MTIEEPTFSDRAHSFGSVADVYERARPGYPEAAIGWAVPSGTNLVVDVGAGTGKLTRLLAGRAVDVVAVEPDPAMRAQLIAKVDGVRVLDGTGEAIPLDDAVADVVTIAQAWHWMDTVSASAEIGRVLRPGGTLALIWNLRDEREDWVGQLWSLLRRMSPAATVALDPPIASPFRAADREHRTFTWTHEQSRDELLSLITSRSDFIVETDESKRAILDAAAKFIDTHPAIAGRDRIPMPYITHVYRFTTPS